MEALERLGSTRVLQVRIARGAQAKRVESATRCRHTSLGQAKQASCADAPPTQISLTQRAAALCRG